MGAGALDPCVARPSAGVNASDTRIHAFHKEIFQLFASFQRGEMESENVFLCHLKNIFCTPAPFHSPRIITIIHQCTSIAPSQLSCRRGICYGLCMSIAESMLTHHPLVTHICVSEWGRHWFR